MFQIIYTSSFNRAFKKFTKNNPVLKQQINDVIELLALNPYSPSLNTHKLTGNLLGVQSCSCGYDCRIIFSIEKINNSDCILLAYIGTHDDVY